MDVGIHNNVANSLVAGCISLGIKLLLVPPIINTPSWDDELMQKAYQSGYVENLNNLSEAVSRSDFVYTDTWVDMEFFHESHYQDEKNRRIEQMLPFQLNRKNLNILLTYQQAENRMHVQKSLLLYLLNNE